MDEGTAPLGLDRSELGKRKAMAGMGVRGWFGDETLVRVLDIIHGVAVGAILGILFLLFGHHAEGWW